MGVNLRSKKKDRHPAETDLLFYDVKKYLAESQHLFRPLLNCVFDIPHESAESDFVLDYIEKIDKDLRGDSKHPNALFVARETKNGFLHAMWQVHNPEIANKYLQDIIISKSYPREMDFVIEKDNKWEHVDWYLGLSKNTSCAE